MQTNQGAIGMKVLTKILPCVMAAVVTAMLIAEPVLAQNTPVSAESAKKALQPLSYGNALNVIGSLMLVLALLFAAAWLMRRGQALIKPRTSHIQVVSQLALGVKEKVLLLKVGDENILLGCSSGNIRSLHTWQGDLPEPTPQSPSSANHFLDVLQQQLKPGSNKGASS